MSVMVRQARLADCPAWERMRSFLWPDAPRDDHATEMEALLADSTWAVFIAEDNESRCGFLEASIRSCAEGCGPGPAGYIEGWYVYPHCRRQGVGRALVHAAEEWALAWLSARPKRPTGARLLELGEACAVL